METPADDPRTPEEDPRSEDVGEGGYPESQHPGAEPGNDEGRERRGRDDAPGTSSSEDSGPRNATGNPRAAGA